MVGVPSLSLGHFLVIELSREQKSALECFTARATLSLLPFTIPTKILIEMRQCRLSDIDPTPPHTAQNSVKMFTDFIFVMIKLLFRNVMSTLHRMMTTNER